MEKDATQVKWEVFRNYVRSWLPVFLVNKKIPAENRRINIVDFFAGPGYYKKNKTVEKKDKPDKGSPILILEIILDYIQNPVVPLPYKSISLYFNEKDKKKFKTLKESCTKFIDTNPILKKYIRVNYFQKDFAELFPSIVRELKEKPNLFILDQFGVKYANPKYVRELEAMKRTDFIYFISSSTLKRFPDQKAIKNNFNLSEEVIQKLKNAPQEFIHNVVVEEVFRKMLSKNSQLYIYPFSLKKGANIYGLIFGTHNLLGAEKFLKNAWEINRLNGEANYDMHQDLKKIQPSLFKEYVKKTKKQLFEERLEKFIKDKGKVSNEEIYLFTLSQGHPPSHASEAVRKMKEQKKIKYSRHPRINYNSVKKQKNIHIFEWIN